MLRRLASILTIISLVFLPLLFAPKTFAADLAKEWKIGDPVQTVDQLDKTMGESGMSKYLGDFCKKRQGNQMNLETWYSGKCTGDTFAGDGVGFSDIVILDLAEKISGEVDPTNTFSSTLKSVFEMLNSPSGTSQNNTPAQQQALLTNVRQKLFANQNNGLLGQTGKMIGVLFENQPASTRSYLAYVSQNLQKHKVIQPAIAASQGIGFATFSPFLTIWMVFRNLAYLGLVVFFIVYGFMMMFRVNLGQKTVISIQLAIPKLIITLLIITFSYAIVGLIYDIMWVVISFIFGYLDTQNLITIPGLSLLASGNTTFGFIGSFIINAIVAGPAAVYGVLSLFLGGIIGGGAFIVANVVGLNLVVSLFIMIALLISYIKLFFKLITALISVIVSLVTAPLVLLGNAFPGSKAIGTWLSSIVANLSVFPVTMLLLMFSYLLMVQPLLGTCIDTIGVPGRIAEFLLSMAGRTTSVPNTCELIFGVKSLVTFSNQNVTGVPLISPSRLAGGFDARGLLALIGLGLLFMSAKYVDIVRDALKVPPFKYGSDIGKALDAPIQIADNVGKRIGELIKTFKPV